MVLSFFFSIIISVGVCSFYGGTSHVFFIITIVLKKKKAEYRICPTVNNRREEEEKARNPSRRNEESERKKWMRACLKGKKRRECSIGLTYNGSISRKWVNYVRAFTPYEFFVRIQNDTINRKRILNNSIW